MVLWFIAPLWLRLPVMSAFFTIDVGEPTSLSRSWQGIAWVMPEVEAVLAPTTGTVTLLVQHGQWVVAGGVVAEIVSKAHGAELVYAPRGGLVTLHMGHLSPDVDPGNRSLRQDGDYVEMGTAVVGIRQSSPLYMKLKGRPFGQFSLTDAEVYVRANEADSGGLGTGWLTASGYVYDDWFTVRLDRFPEAWLDRLTMEIAMRIDGPKGYIVPKRAILPGGGQTEGLMWVIHQKRSLGQRLVKIVDELGDKAVVTGLVSSEQVISYPRILR